TLGYDLGTSGPEKDGVDGSFGKLTETAVNDFQENNRGREGPISHLGV
ncbi:MAG: peptidoglycan-binding protein, partial [Gammaproteobacteria bacterium]|nr:peptidoglycan-binding protein [Gammaproteobacteria bacterium]